MYNPPHPGDVLAELVLEPLGLSVTDAAKALGISRKSLSQLINGRIGVSPMMAVRLGLATNTTAESWMNMQTTYDLWQTRRTTRRLKVKRLEAALAGRSPRLRRTVCHDRHENRSALKLSKKASNFIVSGCGGTPHDHCPVFQRLKIEDSHEPY